MQLELIFNYLSDHLGSNFAYTDFKALTHQLLMSLEDKLDKKGVDAGIIHLHDSLTKEEKPGFMELFTDAVQEVEGFNGRVMMATAVSDLRSYNS